MKAYTKHISLVCCLSVFSQTLFGCGLAMVRLLKPLSYYNEQYGNIAWGLHSMCSLMEGQRNRGQDGAGVVALKLNMPPGVKYQSRIRFAGQNAIDRVFSHVLKDVHTLQPEQHEMVCKDQCRFLGEVYLGHVRYGTYGENEIGQCQPYRTKHNIASKRFSLAGNFNMTNAKDLFQDLVYRGLNLDRQADTFIMLEQIRCQLDREHEYLRSEITSRSFDRMTGKELMQKISDEIDLVRVLRAASRKWDGGYVFGGVLGNGDSFVCRDPAGIRPGYYYMNDEVFAAASERAALCSAFDVDPGEIAPIKPGHVIVLKADGRFEQTQFTSLLPVKECTFERIYFSRAHDVDIYNERKKLGAQLAERVLDALDWDVQNAVFTFIPNSSEPAYFGLVSRVEELVRMRHMNNVWKKHTDNTINFEDITNIANMRVRADRLVFKNQKLRTFIAEGSTRSNLIARLYDVTKGAVKSTDTLIAVDDSIVRGMTLQHSILTQLIRLKPKRIIVVSSAPPILYPDCYGIDMSNLQKFIGFRAAVALIKERGNEQLLKDIEQACLAQEHKKPSEMRNLLASLYDQFSLQELEEKIAELVYPQNEDWQGEIKIIYQTVDKLHEAINGHHGDWYFTGNYPTTGGYKVLNQSFINWAQGKNKRAY